MYRALPNHVKQPRPSRSFRLSSGAVLGAVLLSLLGAVTSARQAQPACPPLGAPSDAIACRPDPASTRLFTPHDVPPGTYRTFVSQTPIEKVAAAFAARSPADDRAPGAWTLREMDPLDAFGDGGPYDEAKVARLYVGRRARVAGGPIVEGGRTVASITLISPYPDATLSRLVPGTLIIEFNVGSR